MNLFIATAYAQEAADKTQSATNVDIWQDFLHNALMWGVALLVFLLSFWFAEIIKKFVVMRLARRGPEIHREVIILTERVTYFVVLILGLTVALSIVDINIMATLGFMSLGIGFALKDLLGNFIAGVVILTQKKFKIGDFIKIGDRIGTITNIETRTTDVKSIDGTQLIVPNAHLMTDVVQNFTANNFRRISIMVGVHYDTPLRDVINLTLDVVNDHPDVVPDPASQVLVTEFQDSSINLEVRFWIDSRGNWQLARSEIIQDIKVAYDKAGVVIPFPIRTLALDPFDQRLMGTVHQKAQSIPFQQGEVGKSDPNSEKVEIKTQVRAVPNRDSSAPRAAVVENDE